MSLRRAAALAWEALLLELAVYRALLRWVARRTDVPAGAQPIGYAQLVAPMLWLWIFGSATEVVVIEVVLRHIDAGWAEAVRLPLLILGIWGVLWMLGLLAAHRVRPHLVTDDRLHLRAGLRASAVVPRDAIVSARAVEHELPSTIRSLHHEDGLLLVGVSGRTNVEVALAGPVPVVAGKRELVAERVGFWVDDPRAVVALLAPRVTR